MPKHQLSSIDRKFPWSFLGVILSLIFGAFGLYSMFVYEKSPDLVVEVVSTVPVLSIQENVQDLQIFFAGTDIIQSHQALSLVSLRLLNRGELAIRPGDFDVHAPIVFNVVDGEIVKADLLDKNSEYLQSVFNRTSIDKSSIVLPSFILEPGQDLLIQILVLHSETLEPNVRVAGKVAEVESIPVIALNEGSKATTSFSFATGGGLIVQFWRIVIYGVGMLGITIGGALLLALISDARYRKRVNKARHKIETGSEELIAALPEDLKHEFELMFRQIMGAKSTGLLLLAKEMETHLSIFKNHPEAVLENEAMTEMILSRLGSTIPSLDLKRFKSSRADMARLIELLALIFQNRDGLGPYWELS